MSIITAVAQKPTAESKLGISFSRTDAKSPLVIEKIKPDGLFASSELKAGMLVESIMGIPMMFSSPKEAVDALRVANAGEVEIKAIVSNAHQKPTQATVPAKRPNPEPTAADVAYCCCFCLPQTTSSLILYPP